MEDPRPPWIPARRRRIGGERLRSENPTRNDREERLLALGDHRVVLAYDPDGEAWYVRTSSVPGLAAEAETVDELAGSLPALIRQLTLP